MKISHWKSTLAAFLFAGIFVFMCFELVMDERTYMAPPTYSEAENTLTFWLKPTGLLEHPDARFMNKKEKLTHYMSSASRYEIHQAFLSLILIGYLVSAYLVWKRYAAALNVVMLTFALKIMHGFYFVSMGYYGKKVSADLVGAAPPSIFAFNPNEQYYLTGIVLSVLILTYFYLVKRKQLEPAVLLRF